MRFDRTLRTGGTFRLSRERDPFILKRIMTGIQAVIDVGTNSIKLLVGEVERGTLTPLLDTTARHPARLGRGYYESRNLQHDAIAGAIDAINELIKRAERYQPASIRLVATSAVRDARNRTEFETMVRERTGLPLEVVSGEREAELIHRGVMSDPSIGPQSLVIMDVGGGSTEIVIAHREELYLSRSFPLGAVRMMEILRPQDPPTAGDRERCDDFLEQYFSEFIVPAVQLGVGEHGHIHTFVATGGTAACMAMMHAPAQRESEIEAGICLTREDVRFQADRVWNLSLIQRQQIKGLPEKRADVILTGAAIFNAALSFLGFDELVVSRRGLRFGVLSSDSARTPATDASLANEIAQHRIRIDVPGGNSEAEKESRRIPAGD